MNWRILIIILVTTTFFTACGGEANQSSTDMEEQPTDPKIQQEEALWKEVMKIHDEVMPKTSNINRISRELKQKIENDPNIEEGLLIEIQGTLEQLEKADEAMFAWMEDHDIPKELRDNKSHEEIMEYLKTEKEEIKEVRDLINSSIESGEKILKVMESGKS